MIWMILGIVNYILAYFIKTIVLLIIGTLFIAIGFYKWAQLKKQYIYMKNKNRVERAMW